MYHSSPQKACKSRKRPCPYSKEGNTKTPEKKHRYLNLKSRRYGRAKHPASGRYGKYTEMMRKQYDVHVPIRKPGIKPTLKPAADIIDLTTDLPQRSNDVLSCFWVSLPTVTLTERDRLELVSGSLLSDKHVQSCHILIKQQHPNIQGLTDPILLSNDLFQAPTWSHNETTIQIHNIPGHWLMPCSKGETVFVDDSLSNVLSSLMERQLSLVYKTKDNNPIKVIVKCSQNQVGGRDCGLFAAWTWFQSGINTDGAHNPVTTRRVQKGDIVSLNRSR